MAQFFVVESFQFGGSLRRQGAILTVDDFEAVAEQKRGDNDETGKPLSGLINHCRPNDEHTEDLMAGKVKPKKDPAAAEKQELADEKQREIKRLREAFKSLGKAFNPKWAIDKLQKELKNAKKEVGELKDGDN